MKKLSEDKVLSSELVHSFPNDMLKHIENVLNRLSDKNVKGLSAIKGINEHYNIVFEIEELYKLLFDYYENKTMSLKFNNKENEQILNVKDITEASEEKLNLIVEVINETIYKDSLINNIDSNEKRTSNK